MAERARKVVVFGATSAIAEQAARLLAAERAELFLVARDPARLAAVGGDLRLRGATVAGTACADLDDGARHGALVAAARQALGEVDLVLVAHGVLADTEQCERDPGLLARVLHTDFVGAAALCQAAAADLAEHGGGVLVAVSSVAGDRARASNYAYGAAKGGLSLFLDGLGHRLHARGVRVVTVKPGRVDTPMTAHLPPSALSVHPQLVGRAILRASDGRRAVVYVPGAWRLVMWVIRLLPRFVMRRLRF